ncbi:hypothetical protein BKA70DRAFT_1577786 [Coprinopsis sp. MPI-PUGE-AT-0042]|nr:hypothetical protein BKA70DRAFT_1577786 [Coprinopsis sp. MPI-PUGE-AT-0042]
MIPDPRLKTYVSNNAPLPENLQNPLNRVLEQLDRKWETYEYDRKRIVESMDARRSMIVALEREIEFLRKVETRLITGQAALQYQKTQYERTMAPIRRVPPEVVATIVRYAIMEQHRCLGHEGRLSFLRLRSVCRLWRTTSFSTPSLWRNVTLAPPDGMGYVAITKAWMQHYLTPWFARAGNGAPLHLEARVTSPAEVWEVLDFVSQSGFNVVHLAVTPSSSAFRMDYSALEILSHPYGRHLPVKYLVIGLQNYSNWTNIPPPHQTIDIANNFPSLTQLHLEEFGSPMSLLPVIFVHSNLQTFQLQKATFTPERFTSLLSGLPQLLHLCLQDCIAQHSGAGLLPYTHSSIISLKLSGSFPEDLLDHLTLPMLERITAEVYPHSYGVTLDAGRVLAGFMERCGGRITFDLLGMPPRKLLLKAIFRSTTVTHLTLSTYSMLESDTV